MQRVIFTPRQQQTLDAYLRDIRHYSIIPDEQLRQMISDYHTTGDRKIRDRIFNANLRYVVTVAKLQMANISSKHLRSRVDIQDLLSEGNAGLLLAIEHYDPTQSIIFISYAAYWIKKCISEYLKFDADTIHQPDNFVPDTDFDAIYQFGQPESYYEDDDQQQTHRIHVASLSATIAHDSDGEERTLLDMLAVSDEQLADSMQQEAIIRVIHNALLTLSKREASILRLSYGIGDSDHPSDGIRVTDEDIAKLLDLTSTERVRQLREQAQRKLANRISRSFTE